MKAVIVNCSDTFEYRVDMVYDCLKNMGWQVEVIASDYMHIEKKKRTIDKPGYIPINTIPYKKNISLTRLYSHHNFAKKAKKMLADKSFCLLYLVVPANSVAAIAKKYKNSKNVKIIIDIIDLWPESLPIKGTDKFPFSIWANIRNKNLRYADCIITECDLYREKLKNVLAGKRVETIYWCHKDNHKEYVPTSTLSDELTLCYLGSVNNIIDIPRIGEIVQKLTQKQSVTVKLIAAGEKKQELIAALKTAGAKVVDCGKVYEYDKKKQIIDTCHYGINIMKPTVNVGISMKSIDYLEMGLPIINSLEGDLGRIIEEYSCGVNIKNIVENIGLLKETNMEMRKKSRYVYEMFFSEKIFNDRLFWIINGVFG